MNVRTMLGLLCAGLLTLPVWSAPAEAPAGMEKVKVRPFDQVFAKPGAQWSKYKTVVVDPLDMSKASIDPPSSSGRHKVKVKPLTEQQIALFQEAYMKAFVRELTEDELFVSADKAQADSLRISAVMLEIAPTYLPDPEIESSGRNAVYAESAGSLTIQFDIYDATSGELLAQVVDKRDRTTHGMWREINRVEARSQMKQIMSNWARLFRSRLEEAMQTEQ